MMVRAYIASVVVEPVTWFDAAADLLELAAVELADLLCSMPFLLEAAALAGA